MKKCFGCMRDYPDDTVSCPICGWSDADGAGQWREAPETLPPETILNGRFIVGRILSLTDFSVVYIAWDALLRRRLVIREFLPYGISERRRDSLQVAVMPKNSAGVFEECEVLFETEMEKLGKNQDIDGILHYYRHFRENGTVYSVSEYIEGWTLEDLMLSKPDMKQEQAFEIIQRIGEILCQLHRRGITHCNLSPDNIYISDKNQTRLIDFGETKRSFCMKKRDAEGIIDLRYAAPEFFSSVEAAEALDAYALGAIYFRLVSGKMPPLRRRGSLHLKDQPAGGWVSRLTDPDPERRAGWFRKQFG